MYSVEKDRKNIYELRERNTDSWIRVYPERGGIIINFGVNGKEILYLNEDTLFKANTHISGGIPVLFPISGRLKDDKYKLNGNTYHMEIHGIARTNPFIVKNTSTDNEASITLSFKSNEQTKLQYPFDFELCFKYILKDGMLTIEQEYYNNSKDPMPVYVGLHPYFKAEKSGMSFLGDFSYLKDSNINKNFENKVAIDISSIEESLILEDFKNNEIRIKIPELSRNIRINFGPEFKYVVLWTMEDKDFICVEPWMAKPGALNSKEGLYYINPGEKLKTFVSFSVDFAHI